MIESEPEPTMMAAQIGATAEVVETDRVIRANDVENDRKVKADSVESDRSARARRVQKQMVVLAVSLVAAFSLVAYRSEVNANNIRNEAHNNKVALYQTCLATAARTEAINPGRIALVELLLNLADSDQSSLTPQQKVDASETLRAGLVVPSVNCGERP